MLEDQEVGEACEVELWVANDPEESTSTEAEQPEVCLAGGSTEHSLGEECEEKHMVSGKQHGDAFFGWTQLSWGKARQTTPSPRRVSRQSQAKGSWC